MKKFIFPVLFCLVALFAGGCAPKTEFDEKNVKSIVVTTADGMTDVPHVYTRTFDFRTGAVTDEDVADIERLVETYAADYRWHMEQCGELPGETPEEYEARMRERFNHPTAAAEFSPEQGARFLERVISLGIYTWKDRYEMQEIIYDGAGFSIAICFSDGTKKTTYFYFLYPRNFERIKEAFSAYLGVSMYAFHQT